MILTYIPDFEILELTPSDPFFCALGAHSFFKKLNVNPLLEFSLELLHYTNYSKKFVD